MKCYVITYNLDELTALLMCLKSHDFSGRLIPQDNVCFADFLASIKILPECKHGTLISIDTENRSVDLSNSRSVLDRQWNTYVVFMKRDHVVYDCVGDFYKNLNLD